MLAQVRITCDVHTSRSRFRIYRSRPHAIMRISLKRDATGRKRHTGQRSICLRRRARHLARGGVSTVRSPRQPQRPQSATAGHLTRTRPVAASPHPQTLSRRRKGRPSPAILGRAARFPPRLRRRGRGVPVAWLTRRRRCPLACLPGEGAGLATAITPRSDQSCLPGEGAGLASGHHPAQRPVFLQYP